MEDYSQFFSKLSDGDWASLVISRQAVDAAQPLAEIHNLLRTKQGEYSAVLQDRIPIGLCSRGTIGFLMASKFGYSIYSKKLVKDYMISRYLQIREGTPWKDGLSLALSRPEPEFYHDVVLTDSNGLFVGLLSVQSLVKLQSHLLMEQTQLLKKHQEQVIQRERLGALGQMSAGVAHDFNNALTPILGYTELLLRYPHLLKDQTKCLRYLKSMNTAASDAARVVSRLRDFYRTRDRAENFEALDFNDLISQTLLLTQPRWKNQAQMQGVNININLELAGIPLIRGNAAEIREMLTNLIFNCVDAMSKGGIIKFRTYSDTKDVVLDINDTGVGMTEEVRRRCMEPFFTTKGARGTGLGLAMVYGTVQRHDGAIKVESEPGHGTHFSIRIPAYAGVFPESIESQQTSIRGPLHVLLVDDEAAVLEVVSSYFEQDSNFVVTAANGRDGLSKFIGGRFDLVVTDRSMPEMNGDQLAWEIKRTSPATPIIMLTGFGEFMNTKGELPFGVDLIVSKPVKIDELRRAVQSVIVAPSTLS